MVRPKARPSGLTSARACRTWYPKSSRRCECPLSSSKHLKRKREHVNYKGETEGVPLFTSPTLNISRIEVDIEGLEVVRGQR